MGAHPERRRQVPIRMRPPPFQSRRTTEKSKATRSKRSIRSLSFLAARSGVKRDTQKGVTPTCSAHVLQPMSLSGIHICVIAWVGRALQNCRSLSRVTLKLEDPFGELEASRKAACSAEADDQAILENHRGGKSSCRENNYDSLHGASRGIPGMGKYLGRVG